jgi:hypothetical protein
MLNMAIFIFPKIIFYDMFSSQGSVFELAYIAYNSYGLAQDGHSYSVAGLAGYR